ncbi:MAG TPA: hypothetical protein VMS96_03215 [Terriglobales bacterium]|nr:hypothetical protein [Terriglobales bacterium]
MMERALVRPGEKRMLAADLPPYFEERVVCSVAAAVKNEALANIVLAVAEIENGKPGQYVRNANGTLDVGLMQFNTSYLEQLAAYGITPQDVASKGRYPYELATWRIRGHLLNDSGDIWTRAANYHSRTPRYNAIYRDKLVRAAGRWASWLAERFTVRDVTATNSPNHDEIRPEK